MGTLQGGFTPGGGFNILLRGEWFTVERDFLVAAGGGGGVSLLPGERFYCWREGISSLVEGGDFVHYQVGF